ncbi:FixH family protein [bacterium]|nr:FixH family protein [bacterium]MBU1956895.1 FixH family protein [bacterium]
MKASKKGIQKYHLWLLFFFAIFGFTFAMIVWTVKSAVNTPVYEDRSFMASYQDVDDNYNRMFIANQKFNSSYNTEVSINNRTVGMEFSDLRYGQRSLDKMSKNQEMLNLGENSVSVVISDKKSREIISNAKIEFQITRAIEDMYDIDLNAFKFENNVYKTTTKIDIEGNWNIIGKITIGDDVGYLYIKTRTKK